jgi:DNA-binding PadR family transcriptional regulator
MNTVKRYNLNDIIFGIIREMQPISHYEIWFEIGESANIHFTPSQQEIDLSLEKMEQRKILKKIMFPNGREKYLLSD